MKKLHMEKMHMKKMHMKMMQMKFKLITSLLCTGILILGTGCGGQSTGSFGNRENVGYATQEEKTFDRYDLRDEGKVPKVRNQGDDDNCWANAAIAAYESCLLPKNKTTFSPNIMSFYGNTEEATDMGGSHHLAVAYFASWNGPVSEATGLVDSHLEEALILNNRDDDFVKNAIYTYGGVEASMYMEIEDLGDVAASDLEMEMRGDTASESETGMRGEAEPNSGMKSENLVSYWSVEDKKPNHDVVIVGWDDNYPKENFEKKLVCGELKFPDRDGAFICLNSWGTDFGEEGYFYVSYADVNILKQAVIFTKISDVDNYDKIYQSDLLGWVGQSGFGEESAYFANVFTAGESESLAAVSFYTTGNDTEYEVYVVTELGNDTEHETYVATGNDGSQENSDGVENGVDSENGDGSEENSDFRENVNSEFNKRTKVAGGKFAYAGYHTVRLDEAVTLLDNSDYAIIVHVTTPGETKPVAIEYNDGTSVKNANISDGEGYISLYGTSWSKTEETMNANVCLKAFTEIY